MSFDVPAESASEFISSMNIEDREKLERAKKIRVNEVTLVDVPVATRKIRDLKEYRRVIPKSNVAETVDAVLINSGYVATFKGCGSLKLASLLPDESETVDYGKRYSLCYEQLVDTSIGKMSYQEFTYSGLIDIDTMDAQTKEQMDKIMKARASLDEAEEVQKSSPVMTSRIVKLSDSITISLKHTDGTTAIAVYPKFKTYANKYNPLISAFIAYINKMWLTQPDSSGEMQTYLIDNPDIIADVLYNSSDEELEIIRQNIPEIYDIPKFTYGFKGDFYCPNCGKHETYIACKIDDLVFHRIQKHIV